MRRAAVLLALALAAAPAIALAASTQVTPWPFQPPRQFEPGDLIVGVSEWNGEAWEVVGGLTLQPAGSAECGPVIRPTPPAA